MPWDGISTSHARNHLHALEKLVESPNYDSNPLFEHEAMLPEEHATPRIPEHRLILAVIEQAITDATPPEESWCPKIHRARGRHAEHAMRWFDSPAEDAWSFRWCLLHLGTAADAAQQRILRKLRNGTLFFNRFRNYLE